MALQLRPANCDRARAWASLRPDGELSELEEALLAAHLRQCAACAEYAETVQQAMEMLRAQPLEQLDHPVIVPGLRRILLRPTTLARVAAAIAAVVGVTTVLGTESGRQPTEPTFRQGPVAAVDDPTRSARCA